MKPELEVCSSEDSDQHVDTTDPSYTLREKFRSVLHWRVAVMIIGNFVFGWSASMYGVLFPDYIRSNGLKRTDAATLLMIYGGVGTASRLGFVALGQWIIYFYLINIDHIRELQFHVFIFTLSYIVGQLINVKSVYAVIAGHVILGAGLIGLIFSSNFSQCVNLISRLLTDLT